MQYYDEYTNEREKISRHWEEFFNTIIERKKAHDNYIQRGIVCRFNFTGYCRLLATQSGRGTGSGLHHAGVFAREYYARKISTEPRAS